MVQRHQFTVDDYYKMAEFNALGPDARVELIEGEIIDMSPMGSKHAAVVSRINRLFLPHLTETTDLRCQLPVRLSEISEPEPDFALVHGMSFDYAVSHPKPENVLLLIEVADSTLAFDLEVKAPLYAKYGIPEYWVVDLEGKHVHVFRQPEEGVYLVHETLGAADTLDIPASPDARLTLGDFLV